MFWMLQKVEIADFLANSPFSRWKSWTRLFFSELIFFIRKSQTRWFFDDLRKKWLLKVELAKISASSSFSLDKSWTCQISHYFIFWLLASWLPPCVHKYHLWFFGRCKLKQKSAQSEISIDRWNEFCLAISYNHIISRPKFFRPKFYLLIRLLCEILVMVRHWLGSDWAATEKFESHFDRLFPTT